MSNNNVQAENVLFFNLSVLAKECKMNKYQGTLKKGTDNVNGNYTGISQLEAGTKHILCQLALEGKKLDRIVMVTSKATRTDNRQEFVESFWEDYGDDDGQASSMNFYKQRITDYLRRKEDKEIFKDVKDTYYEENKNFETIFPDDVTYTDEEIKKLFIEIPTYDPENDRITEAEKKAHYYKDKSLELFSEIINQIQGKDNRAVDLYVDMQGGIRSAVSQIDAVLELLKDRNVNIKGRYAIKGYRQDVEKVYAVKLVDDEYKAYELVSAMTEFKRYGRGQGLTEFFTKDEEPETQKITELIRKISDAIALCNVKEFENQIKTLKEINKQTEIRTKLKEKNSQMLIVFQDIIADYASLLKDGSTTFDIVKWCVNKSFYQQALTIIESLMPKMLAECGYLQYNPMDEVIVEKEENHKKMKEKIFWVCEQDKRSRNQGWKDNRNILFEQWVHNNTDLREKSIFGIPDEKVRNISGDTDFKKVILEVGKDKGLQWKRKYNSTLPDVHYDRYSINLKNNAEGKLFCLFAALSKVLKDVRNSSNHANSKESCESVRHLLEGYVAIGNLLKLNEKHTEIPQPKQGDKVTFMITNKEEETLKGCVEGLYEGAVVKSCVKGFQQRELKEMIGRTVQAEITGIIDGTYMVKCAVEKKKPETQRTRKVQKKKPEDTLGTSLGDKLKGITLQ